MKKRMSSKLGSRTAVKRKERNTLNDSDIIRAWKDANYRSTLSGYELSMLPTNPAGSIELTDDLLKFVAGGDAATALCTHANLTSGCCQSVWCYTLGADICTVL